MANKFELASQASILVGGGPITDFEGGSAESIAAAGLYDACVDDVVSMHRWRCMSRQAQLSRRSAAPDARWEAAYDLPSDLMVIHGVTINDRLIDFDRYHDSILCDANENDAVILDYTYRTAEAGWPAYFAAVVRFRLAAIFAIPIAEDTDKAAFYERKMLQQYAIAKAIDSQGRTAQRLPVGRLRAYHGGRP